MLKKGEKKFKGVRREKKAAQSPGTSGGASVWYRRVCTALLPHSLQTSRLVSVTSEAFGSNPKCGSFSSASELEWPQLRQLMAIRVAITPARRPDPTVQGRRSENQWRA